MTPTPHSPHTGGGSTPGPAPFQPEHPTPKAGRGIAPLTP